MNGYSTKNQKTLRKQVRAELRKGTDLLVLLEKIGVESEPVRKKILEILKEDLR